MCAITDYEAGLTSPYKHEQGLRKCQSCVVVKVSECFYRDGIFSQACGGLFYKATFPSWLRQKVTLSGSYLRLLNQVLKACVIIQVCIWIGRKCPLSPFTSQTDMALIFRNFSTSSNSIWSHLYHKNVQGWYEREENVNVKHLRGLILGIYCDVIVQCLLSCYPWLHITAHPWPWRLQWCRVVDAASCCLMLVLLFLRLG